MGETSLEREIRRGERRVRRSIGGALLQLREDAGLTQAHVAAAAGIDRSFLGRIETGERAASVAVLVAVATVLGADLAVRAYPTTGPRIHDRTQAAMEEALLRVLHPRWIASPEIQLLQPARGVADLVITDNPPSIVIETELQGELRRLEQQLRWHREKEQSLPSSELWRTIVPPGDEPATSRLLVLRSTAALRQIATTFERTLQAAYPVPSSLIHDCLTSPNLPWPGAGILWVRVERGVATVLEGPPRGVRLGRSPGRPRASETATGA